MFLQGVLQQIKESAYRLHVSKPTLVSSFGWFMKPRLISRQQIKGIGLPTVIHFPAVQICANNFGSALQVMGPLFT